MIKVKFIIALSLLAFGCGFAQDATIYSDMDIVIQDIVKEISKGKQPGLMVEVEGVSKEEVEKAWEKKLERSSKSDIIRFDNEIIIEGAYLDDLSKSMKLYSLVLGYAHKIQLYVFAEKAGHFINQDTDEYEYLAVKNYLREFAQEVYYSSEDDELDAHEKDLKSLKKELKRLIKTDDKIRRNISKENRKIEKIEDEIEMLKSDQKRKMKMIQDQKAKVSQTEKKELKKIAQKEQKKLERESRKLERSIDKEYKKIDKIEADIREYERELRNSEESIARKEYEIDRQKRKVYYQEKKVEHLED